MKTFKKITYLVFLFCVMQWPTWRVESANTAAASTSKASSSLYATTDDKGQEVTSSVLGSIYRKSRQSRCVTCYEDRRYGGGGEDRSRYSGSYSSSYSARSGDDRSSSWYYPSYDRYEERGYRGAAGGEYDKYAVAGADRYGADRYGAGADRYGADRYGADRYGADRYGAPADRYGAGADRYGAGGYRDDRYAARPAYDRYDTRTRGGAYERPAAYDRGESRGYGYDNRDRYGGEQRDRYYERPRYGASAAAGAPAYGYDRESYDRYPPRYDYRNYRPWDETYRGQSGFDSSGRGYYFAKGGSQEDRHYLPEAGYNSPAISPCGAQKPNCPYAPQEGGTRVSSAPIDSGYQHTGVSQTTYNTNSNSNSNDSSKGSGSGWSYMREDEQAPSRGGNSSGSNSSSNNSNNNSNSRDRNRDQQSPAYGALLDRGSNLIAVEPAKAASDSGNNDSMTNNDKPQSSGVNNEKPSDNGQNS